MRRRMMIEVAKSDIEYLKRIGCKLWLPLNNEYGLKAAIGNTEVVNVYSDGVKIVSDLDMALLRYRNINQIVAKIPLNFTEDDFPNNHYTFAITSKKYNNGAPPMIRMSTSDRMFLVYGVGDATDAKRKITFVDIENNIVINDVMDINGKISTGQGQATAFSHPTYNSEAYFAAYGSTPENKYIYIKNIMLFNRELTEKQKKMVFKIMNRGG